MKHQFLHRSGLLLLAACLAPWAGAQTTAFTYQGQLALNGSPASGNFDMKFRLYRQDNSQAGSEVARAGVPVGDGLFTVSLDFTESPFDGRRLWLEMDVKQGASYVTLAPRMELTSTPYAIYARMASQVANGAVGNAQLAVNAIASPNLQDGSVANAKLAAGRWGRPICATQA
jgi:hypothetical protein